MNCLSLFCFKWKLENLFLKSKNKHFFRGGKLSPENWWVSENFELILLSLSQGLFEEGFLSCHWRNISKFQSNSCSSLISYEQKIFYSQARTSALHDAKMECHEKWKMVERCCKVLKEVTFSDDPGSEVKKEKVHLTKWDFMSWIFL